MRVREILYNVSHYRRFDDEYGSSTPSECYVYHIIYRSKNSLEFLLQVVVGYTSKFNRKG